MSLADKYQTVRERTESLAEHIHPEAMVIQVAEFASPPKWHLAHTTWFFENFLLKPGFPDYKVFDPEYDFLFNSYYESLGERILRNSRGALFLPSVDDVLKFREHVDTAILKVLPVLTSEQRSVIEVGLNHEEQHQELLLTDTKYLYSCHPWLPVWMPDATLDKYRKEQEIHWLKVPEGVYPIGHEGKDFAFDNELGQHRHFIGEFTIMDRPVLNGEYLEFILDGGYSNFRYWLSEGWEWVKKNNITKPMHWHGDENEGFSFYHLDGLKAMDPTVPVMHISYFEAEAYAHWKGMSLPTEFEWETAAKIHGDHFGNEVWEWTQSAYLPYPGFKIAPGAIGEYNGKFMINQMVLRGGSLATPPGHSRVTYRNFFHPHLQWQFSGMRLIQRNRNT